MRPIFVELSELRDARNLLDVACVTLGKNSHRLYVRTSGSSYRVDFFKFEESPYWDCFVYFYRGREVVNAYNGFSLRAVFLKFKTMFDDVQS